MAKPSEPITRREQYLNAIANSNTEGIPAEPLTREEQYLDEIARNGGGGPGGGEVKSVNGKTGVVTLSAQITGGDTGTVGSMKSAGTLPSMSVSNHVISFSAGTLPTSEDTTVVTNVGSVNIN